MAREGLTSEHAWIRHASLALRDLELALMAHKNRRQRHQMLNAHSLCMWTA